MVRKNEKESKTVDRASDLEHEALEEKENQN